VTGRRQDRLIGRAPELRVLEDHLAETSRGTGRAVFVVGEPGIGKSHVLAELGQRAEGRGCLVLEGSAAEFEQELAFGVLIDAMDAYLQSLGRTVVERLAADGLIELADVFPSLRRLRPAERRPTVVGERFRMYRAVRELLERLAAQHPVILVLDDLHWADDASLELVSHLLRRPPDAPVLLVGAFRPGQMKQAFLTAQASELAVRELTLGPLSTDEARQLVATTDDRTRQRIYDVSGGNPFYMLQLARAGTALGLELGVAEEPGQVPPAVAAAIAQELAALPSVPRAFAEAAAVVGDPFDFDLAVVAAGIPEPSAFGALDELIARDLVRSTPVPRRFTFRHPLVRSATYQSASVGSRLAAHGRCAEALAASGGPVTARAHHVEHSARRGDLSAVAVLTEAARANAHRLPTSAARWLAAALRLLPDTASAEERAEMLLAQAGALTAARRLDEARTALLAGLAPLAATEAVDLRVRLTAACAGVEQQLGLLEESHARLVAALDTLTERRSEHGVALMVALAADAFYQARYDRLVEWGTAAAAAASDLGDPSLQAVAEAVLAMGCSFTGATADAERHASAAAQMIDAMSDDELAGRLDAVAHLVVAEIVLERFEETAAHARRGLAVGRAAGQDDAFPGLYPVLGTAAWVLGRLAESAEVLDTAIESARLAGNVQAQAWAILSRAIAALVAGDWDRAVALAEESSALTRDASDGFVASHAGVILGWVRCETGDPGRGVELVIDAAGGPDLPRVTGGWRAGTHEVLTRAWIALGRPDEARSAAERAEEVARQVGLPRTKALAHLAAASVALHRGDANRAIDEARQAVASAGEASARYDEAMARVVLGRALAAAGETGPAAASLEEAAAAFEGFGAARRRDQAEHELRKLGVRISRRSQPGRAEARGLDRLSARELEVAWLVVARKTNQEIAADLFLSLKTVETHMRNILRKLDLPSRVEVARVLERARPLPQ
jgi:ATP/maltotriose-dependent transcriptional regulator MalT